MTTPTASLTAEQAVIVKRSATALQRQFQGVFARETIERFLAEGWDQLSGAKVRTWVPVLAERLAAERLRALAKIEGHLEVDVPYVLFLCVHNAGRSQMAAGWLQHLAGDGVVVFSGGSDPTSEVNPAAIAAMAEVGIDITTSYPKPWTDEVVRAADAIVTMGCGDACPICPGKRYEDWELTDPAGLGVQAVRPIRDELEQRVRHLMDALGVPAVR